MGEVGQVPGAGWEPLALSFVSLGAVCVVAWLALKLLAGKGIGKASGALRVVARLPLEPRRSVYVIEAAGRCFLVGVGEGPMAMLAELDAAALPRADVAAPPRFAEVLARALGRPRVEVGPGVVPDVVPDVAPDVAPDRGRNAGSKIGPGEVEAP
jgi:flagellar biosynthetic protein FliO